MKLIIDIDEEVLNKLPEAEQGSNVIKEALEAVEDGIPLTDILDKMRAEIKALKPIDYAPINPFMWHRGAKDDVLQIINKYKTESEK